MTPSVGPGPSETRLGRAPRRTPCRSARGRSGNAAQAARSRPAAGRCHETASSRRGAGRKLAAAVVAGLLLASFAARPAAGFGKNKINYQVFDWKVYHAPHFDVYYYPEEEALLQQMVRYAESAYLQLSKALDHEVKIKIPLIYFKTHVEFEQNNIILSFIPEAVGAFAEPIENRMVLPVDMPPDELYALTVHELTHIFWYSILFQGQLRRSFRANPPLWLSEGLAEHFSGREDPFDAMVIRDAVVNNIVPPITQVNSLSFLTYRFGEAAFAFIEQKYGNEGIRNLLFEYRKVLLTNNLGKAIKESFGIEADEFDRLFQRYLRKEYLPILLENQAPQDYGREIGVKKPGVFTFSPSLSPSGELLAVLTTKKEEVDVVVLSARDGKVVRNLTPGFTNEYEYISTGIFKGHNDVSWSPAGDNVAFFARKEDKRLLFVVNALTGKVVRKQALPIAQLTSPSFSPDGQQLLFSGNLGGVVDIFRLDLESGEVANVTKDDFYDTNPRWSPDGKTVVYNRRINQYEKIFLVDLEDPDLKTQLTFGEHSDLQPSFSLSGKEIYFTSDATPERIFNIYSLDLESGELVRWTEVIGGNFTPMELAREEGTRTLAVTSYEAGRYRLFRMELRDPLETVRPEDREYEPVEVVPFEPPLLLTLDDSQKGKYKLKWHFEGNPNVLVGIADDGTVLTNAQLVFTDLFGDHRIFAMFSSVSTFSNFDILYVNYKRRWDWFAEVLDYRDYFVVSTSGGSERINKLNSITGALAGIIYPLNKFHRISTSLGYYDRGTEIPVVEEVNGVPFLNFNEFSGGYPQITFSFSGDNVRFKQGVGPWQGRRYDLTIQYAPVATGDWSEFVNYYIDWRNYAKLTARSTFAIRFFTAISNGTTNDSGINSSNVFSIGGFNQIRGYEYREFFGNRAGFANFELRFPLLDALVFNRYFGVPSIQGVLFLDIGTAYYRGDVVWDPNRYTVDPFFGCCTPRNQTGGFRSYDFYGKRDIFDGEFDANGEPLLSKSYSGFIDGRASYGFGLNFYFGPLNLNWSFARQLPYLETELDTRADGTPILDCLPSGDPNCVTVPSFRFVEADRGGYTSSFWIGTKW